MTTDRLTWPDPVGPAMKITLRQRAVPIGQKGTGAQQYLVPPLRVNGQFISWPPVTLRAMPVMKLD
jgi:hypothetical protein